MQTSPASTSALSRHLGVLVPHSEQDLRAKSTRLREACYDPHAKHVLNVHLDQSHCVPTFGHALPHHNLVLRLDNHMHLLQPNLCKTRRHPNLRLLTVEFPSMRCISGEHHSLRQLHSSPPAEWLDSIRPSERRRCAIHCNGILSRNMNELSDHIACPFPILESHIDPQTRDHFPETTRRAEPPCSQGIPTYALYVLYRHMDIRGRS